MHYGRSHSPLSLPRMTQDKGRPHLVHPRFQTIRKQAK